MTKLANKAGTAGVDSSSIKNRLGIVASFLGAATMAFAAFIPATGAFAIPDEPEAPPSAPQATPSVKEAANNNFKVTGPVIDPGSEWTIRLSGEVNQSSMERIINKMRELNGKDPKREITLLINSPGGSVGDGLALYDVMQSISNDVRTVCEGQAASMAAVILASGTPGKRYSYESCQIMIHELSWGTKGKITEMNNDALSGARYNELMVEIYMKHTGLSRKALHSIMTIDLYLDGAQEGKDIGVIDHVIPHKPIARAEQRQLPASFCDKPERQKLQACPVAPGK